MLGNYYITIRRTFLIYFHNTPLKTPSKAIIDNSVLLFYFVLAVFSYAQTLERRRRKRKLNIAINFFVLQIYYSPMKSAIKKKNRLYFTNQISTAINIYTETTTCDIYVYHSGHIPSSTDPRLVKGRNSVVPLFLLQTLQY